jgi:hypothetical protein
MWTILVAVAMGIAIYAVAKWMINLLATPPPPEPNPDDLVEVERKYHCTVCGLRLTVTHTMDEEGKAPRHCMEEMDEVPV